MSATVPMSCETASEWAVDGYWPDLDYIRRRISIRHVGRELGLEVFGNSARCWRTDDHQNNDRSPSLSFTRYNRAKCHVCDSRSMGVLDLVMAVRGSDLRAAVEWVTARWDVPQVNRGKHVNRREPNYPRLRVLTNGSPFEYLVRVGLWASLGKAAKSVLVVIFAFADVDTRTAQLSFRALRRYAGLSFRSVAKGIQELERVGLLQVDRAFDPAAPPPERTINAYKLCLTAPKFLEYISLVQKRHSAEIQLEKEFQKQRRRSRKGATAIPRVLLSLPSRAPDKFALSLVEREIGPRGKVEKGKVTKPAYTNGIHPPVTRGREVRKEQVHQASAPSDRVELERLRLEAEILGRRERARRAEELRRELNAGRGPALKP